MGTLRSLLLLGMLWGLIGCAATPPSQGKANLEEAAKINVQL